MATDRPTTDRPATDRPVTDRPTTDRPEYMRQQVENMLREALTEEVETTPKPGLVDLHDNGAHRDMDPETFRRSTQAITPFLGEMFLCGFAQQKENAEEKGLEAGACERSLEERIFLRTREIGQQAEKAMFAATGGVNTHKGMIFTMGILAAAAGIVLRRGEESSEILPCAREMTAGILEKDFAEMAQREPQSHGERLFRSYGERGIRGQACLGFPILRDTGLPALKQALLQAGQYFPEAEGISRLEQLPPELRNRVRINVLLRIMAELNDTNVLIRSSREELLALQRASRELLETGGAMTQAGLERIAALNQTCIRKNISPGGAADILAAVLFLHKLEGLPEMNPENRDKSRKQG